MKEKVGYLIVILFMVLLLAGCGAQSGDISREVSELQERKQTVEDNMVRLSCIQMTVASPNDAHIYSAKYPHHFYYVDKDEHKCQLIDMRNKPSKTISRDDFDVFAEFIRDIDKMQANASSAKGDVFAYSIYVSYYDSYNNLQSMYCSGYDSFPEELNTVIDKFNELCGGTILLYPNETIVSDVDFLYQEFGYSEADFPRQDIEAMLEDPHVSVAKLISSTNTLASYMDGYYTSLELDKIKDKLPDGTETGQNVSMQELEQFAKEFAASLGTEWQISESSKSTLLFEVTREGEFPMLVGRVIDIPSFSPDLQNASIFIMDGPEGEGYNSSYVIDSSGNYFLAEYMRQEDFVSIVELFTEK